MVVKPNCQTRSSCCAGMPPPWSDTLQHSSGGDGGGGCGAISGGTAAHLSSLSGVTPQQRKGKRGLPRRVCAANLYFCLLMDLRRKCSHPCSCLTATWSLELQIRTKKGHAQLKSMSHSCLPDGDLVVGVADAHQDGRQAVGGVAKMSFRAEAAAAGARQQQRRRRARGQPHGRRRHGKRASRS